MSDTRAAAFDRIADSGVVAIVRGIDADTAIETISAVTSGGVDTVEITANTPGVMEMLAEVSSSFTQDEVLLGAGTVLDPETARAAMLAGARFVVTPSLNEDVIETANRYGAPSFPGVMTPTEAVRATEAGADAVKVFPAGQLGPGFVRSLGGPLGHIDVVPTGGVSLDNVRAFLDAGALGVGVGSSIVDNDAIARGDFGTVEANARAFREAVDEARADD